MKQRKKPETVTFDVERIEGSTIENVDSNADKFVTAPGGIHGSKLDRIRHRIGAGDGKLYNVAMLIVAVVAAAAAVVALL